MFSLLYRSSSDGSTVSNFHSKCDNQGCTLTLIEATNGFVLGGYCNTPWGHTSSYSAADKAFLFVLSRNDVTHPKKMKLKNPYDPNAVYNDAFTSKSGPRFGTGHDLYVSRPARVSYRNDKVHWNFGNTYEPPPSYVPHGACCIKEMEVFL